MKFFTENSPQMKNFSANENNGKSLSELIYEAFKPYLSDAAKEVTKKQIKNFVDWNEKRKQLIEAQVNNYNILNF